MLKLEKKIRRQKVKETTGYWKLNEEALDLTLWRAHFGGYHVPIIRQTKELIYEVHIHRRQTCYVEFVNLTFVQVLRRLWNWYRIQVTLFDM